MRYVLPDHVIDLNCGDGLSYIRDSNGALEIGANDASAATIEFSALVRERCPLMHEAIAQVGHRQTRNRGTLGARCAISIRRPSWSRSAARTRRPGTSAGKDRGAQHRFLPAFPVRLYERRAPRARRASHRREFFPAGPRGHGAAFVEFPAAMAISPLSRRRRCSRKTTPAKSPARRSPSVAWARRRCAPPTWKRTLIGEKIGDKGLRELCEPLRKL